MIHRTEGFMKHILMHSESIIGEQKGKNVPGWGYEGNEPTHSTRAKRRENAGRDDSKIREQNLDMKAARKTTALLAKS
jgi:hypothetical protein